MLQTCCHSAQVPQSRERSFVKSCDGDYHEENSRLWLTDRQCRSEWRKRFPEGFGSHSRPVPGPEGALPFPNLGRVERIAFMFKRMWMGFLVLVAGLNAPMTRAADEPAQPYVVLVGIDTYADAQ